MDIGVGFDATELMATLKRLDTEGTITPAMVGRGLFQSANALLKDAIYVKPMAPKDVGDLRGSARTMGGDGILHKSGDRHKPDKSGNQLSVVCGFNIVYAAKWHEVPESRKINWTTDKGASDPGPKYLEKKMAIFGKRYTEIIGEFVAELLKTATAGVK
jgi:hypothetical protein